MLNSTKWLNDLSHKQWHELFNSVWVKWCLYLKQWDNSDSCKTESNVQMFFNLQILVMWLKWLLVLILTDFLFVFVPGRALWSPRWSAWLEPYERRLGRVMWTAVDPWEFSFVLNTGYLFSYYILYMWSCCYLFGVADELCFIIELWSVSHRKINWLPRTFLLSSLLYVFK